MEREDRFIQTRPPPCMNPDPTTARDPTIPRVLIPSPDAEVEATKEATLALRLDQLHLSTPRSTTSWPPTYSG